MKISYVPNKEVVELYKSMSSNSVEEVRACLGDVVDEDMFYRLCKLVEVLHKVCNVIIAQICITEILIKFKRGQLNKVSLAKILVKYGVCFVVLNGIPYIVDKIAYK